MFERHNRRDVIIAIVSFLSLIKSKNETQAVKTKFLELGYSEKTFEDTLEYLVRSNVVKLKNNFIVTDKGFFLASALTEEILTLHKYVKKDAR